MLAADELPYEKLPPPPWYNNKIGVTDKAPAPFTPVQREGSDLSVWGRRYAFADRLLPTAIVTEDQDILAGPVELIITDDTGRTHSSAAATAAGQWSKHTQMRLEFERTANLGGAQVLASSWMECDGLLWTRLRVAPGDSSIRKMVLRIPVKKH